MATAAALAVAGVAVLRQGGPSTHAAETARDAYWSKLYVNATLEQVMEVQHSLRSALSEMTQEYYDTALMAGDYVVSHPVPDKNGRLPIPNTGDDLSSTVVSPTGEMKTVRLPHEGFAEAYAIRDELAWIMHRVNELKHAPGAWPPSIPSTEE